MVLLVELLWFLVSAATMPWGRAGVFEARHLRLSRMGSQPLTVGRGGVVEFGVLERNCRSDVWMWLRDVDGVIDSGELLHHEIHQVVLQSSRMISHPTF